MENVQAMDTQPAASEQLTEAALPAEKAAEEAPTPVKAPPPALLTKEKPKDAAPEIGQLITLSEDLQVVRFTNGIIHRKQKGKDPSTMSGFTGSASTNRGSAPDTDSDPIE